MPIEGFYRCPDLRSEVGVGVFHLLLPRWVCLYIYHESNVIDK